MPRHNATQPGGGKTARLAVLVLAIAALVAAIAYWRRDPALAEMEQRLQEGSAEQVLGAADLFLARDPDNGRALTLKARALTELGRWSEACDIFAKTSVQSSADMQAWATALVNRQKWRDALPLLAQLLELNPHDALALRHVATCQYQLGQADAALDSAARLAEIHGHEVEGRFLSGVIHRAQGDLHLSIANWRRIQTLRPNADGLPVAPAEFFLIYGEDLLLEGTPQMAIIKLQTSREFDEQLPVLLRLGQAWAIAGDEDQAAAAWTSALDRDPHNPVARQGLAELSLGRSRADEALQWLEPLAVQPNVSSTTAYLMERAHTLLGNEDELVHWQRRTAALRLSERREAALARKLRSSG